ncbi:MAG: hypothetical protein U5L06_10675 [Rhodovibrio sp.]|nr:hypothetical protein [Rhodovibrio sp.]
MVKRDAGTDGEHQHNTHEQAARRARGDRGDLRRLDDPKLHAVALLFAVGGNLRRLAPGQQLLVLVLHHRVVAVQLLQLRLDLRDPLQLALDTGLRVLVGRDLPAQRLHVRLLFQQPQAQLPVGRVRHPKRLRQLVPRVRARRRDRRPASISRSRPAIWRCAAWTSGC